MFENIKPKYWKWAEARLLGVNYPSKFAPFGHGGFTINEWEELDNSPLIAYKEYIRLKVGLLTLRKISWPATKIIFSRIDSDKLYLNAPLKYCTKEELKRLALRNCVKHVAGWGAYWQESYKFLKDTYLPLSACLHGHTYWLHARNFQYGVFDKRTNGFVGIREKFGQRYLFTEYHWDVDELHGTVKPLQFANKIEYFSKIPNFIDVHDGQSNFELFDYLNQFVDEKISLEDYIN